MSAEEEYSRMSLAASRLNRTACAASLIWGSPMQIRSNRVSGASSAVAGGFRFEFGEELGQFVGLVHVDLVARRQGVEDEARFRVAGQHILALGVGLRAGEAVADDNPRNGVAVCARDISVGVAAVGNDLSAVSAVIVIAVSVRAGRENRDRAEEKQQSV